MAMLYANCSEATIKLNVTDYPEEIREKIYHALEEIEAEHDGSDKKLLDDDCWWYDTSCYRETMFKLEVIVVHGDVPYNNQDKLEEAFKKKLAKIEYYKETPSITETTEPKTRYESINGAKPNKVKKEKERIDLRHLANEFEEG